jgi:hypothetical protein
MHLSEGGSEYYIVRVYRQRHPGGRDAPELVGLVENREGKRQAFHGFEELMRILFAAMATHDLDE